MRISDWSSDVCSSDLNHHHIHTVDLPEFRRFGVGGTGHAGQLVVETEVILEGGGRQCLAFLLDVDAFLRFDGLMYAFAPAPPRQDRKRVVSGTSGSVRVDFGGRRLIKQNKKTN